MNQPLYLVAGLGKTGQSIAGYLRRRNKPFVVFDTRREVAGLSEFTSEFPGVDVFLGAFPTTLYEQLAGIITSPGVPLDEPFLQRAFQLNIPVYGDIECLAHEIQAPVIAITGTNGKSTVTTLVGEMAKAAGLTAAVAGNIGFPVLDLLDDGNHYDLWVLELSSFQLDLTHSLKPIAATILNISPDHLDRHHTLDAYIKAKQRIYHRAEFLLYNREDKATYPQNKTAKAISYGLDAPAEGQWGIVEHQGKLYLAHGKKRLLSVEQLRLKGKHNWQNALAACALATSAGINAEFMVKVLETFSGLPHRCQWVRNIDGVDWINDSKGTNIGAAISAISGIGSAMHGKVVLIAGGIGKGADFTELRSPVADYVRSVVLIGEDADKIQAALANVVPVLRASSLEGAVTLAKSQAIPGDVVLLSPACASFDMFRDFNHRGESFANLVAKL
ncbi:MULTISPECIES: UDP-N-acetylmuramoyl-L-alanine--D-glutamate ligase [Legionella]|uniref:UDP-N-acetylmuramoylalanine--D-glutamate ligase n=1 Tax=Legionella maceachernii TaxID=466 RepID=A0A0W0W6L8_9GAMM|nr:UDP-N-acetylmuramoyl-L-alanine--D-glutamate ligase [Legionella maceachernii]KTD28015.1 UDP-N-acetylmuramoylalanine--D-glutamate ligase [Legionella maceachernii]SKA06868.1 UDP-N-acetylmuramoylalanine--D-glutamate ligase [Legionella maceachernii]SUO99864.1 UDP-N-acetylmuramoylalanine--D-glutamate ligase [Legionella maceachernii]